VPDLVLDLRGQGQLPPKRGCPHQPLALGEDTHQLAVGVHLDEAQDGGPVLVGHPVGRLDLEPGRDMLLEQRVSLVVRQVLVERRAPALERAEDRFEGERVGHDGPPWPWTARNDRSA
jgi:hypothetical protein